MTKPIMTPETYGIYRRHCRTRGYCDPFIPYVGADYARADVKMVYCGGAAWWNGADQPIDDDVESLARVIDLTGNFVSDGMYSTPFWRLFRQIAAIVPGLAGQSESDVLRRFAWTNISKTGLVGENAPPGNDLDLRELDVAQFQYEMGVLRPDLLVCVSGSLVTPTAYRLFDNPEWRSMERIGPMTKSTWIRRSPWGGWLLWTMHPAYKPASWNESVLDDVRRIITLIEPVRNDEG